MNSDSWSGARVRVPHTRTGVLALVAKHAQKPLGRRANFPGPARRMYADTPRNAKDGS